MERKLLMLTDLSDMLATEVGTSKVKISLGIVEGDHALTAANADQALGSSIVLI